MNARTLLAGILIAVVLVLTDCATDGAGDRVPEEGQIPTEATPVTVDRIEPVYAGAYAGIRDERRLVIRDRAAWEAFWSELTANRVDAPPAPEIDFATRMVLAATMGERRTGGYAIEIPRAARAGDRLWVDVVSTSPGPTCITTQALTAPAAAVTVPRSDAAVSFVERAEARDC